MPTQRAEVIRIINMLKYDYYFSLNQISLLCRVSYSSIKKVVHQQEGSDALVGKIHKHLMQMAQSMLEMIKEG